jgi:hypothetical protein
MYHNRLIWRHVNFHAPETKKKNLWKEFDITSLEDIRMGVTTNNRTSRKLFPAIFPCVAET